MHRCICIEYDESGYSVCGASCPIHAKEMQCDHCHGLFKNGTGVNTFWCSDRCFNRGEED